MARGASQDFQVFFKEEFDLCLDRIEAFFAEQGHEPLHWWYDKEIEIIDYIERVLTDNPFAGRIVERGSFKGLRRITYGKSRHLLLNYLIYYVVYEQDRAIDVINIVPSRSKRKRVYK